MSTSPGISQTSTPSLLTPRHPPCALGRLANEIPNSSTTGRNTYALQPTTQRFAKPSVQLPNDITWLVQNAHRQFAGNPFRSALAQNPVRFASNANEHPRRDTRRLRFSEELCSRQSRPKGPDRQITDANYQTTKLSMICAPDDSRRESTRGSLLVGSRPPQA